MGDADKWHLIQSRLHRRQAVEVTRLLDDRGIPCVVLKGVAVERFYPPDRARPSVDLDIAVAPENFERAIEFRSENLFGNYLVDLHEGLRHFDNREWKEVFERTELVDLEDGRIRVLSEEDQLRVIAVHWLTDGGENRERLWDIHFLVKNKKASFDWDYCLNANGPTRRLWIVCSIGLAAKYTGLDIDELSISNEAKKLPEWLVRTLEKRWADDISFAPLDTSTASFAQFLSQIRRRFPPNGVMATVGLEGEFDSGSRLPYQFRYFFNRLAPSVSRTIRAIFGRFRF